MMHFEDNSASSNVSVSKQSNPIPQDSPNLDAESRRRRLVWFFLHPV